ncbi:MAG: HflK protein, partial [Sulfitobacter sp.]
MTGNTGGPWGGGGNSGGGNSGDNQKKPGNNRPTGGNRGPGSDKPQIPEIDDLVKKGQERLRVLMGGKGGGNGAGGPSGGGMGNGPRLTRGTVGLGALAAVVLWGMASFYTVRPEQQ